MTVMIRCDEAGWDCRATLTNADDLEGFVFLQEMDPLFTLRLDSDSTIEVIAGACDDTLGFALREVRAEDLRSRAVHMQGSAEVAGVVGPGQRVRRGEKVPEAAQAEPPRAHP